MAQAGIPSFFNEFANGFIAFLPMGINRLTSYYLQPILSVKKSLCSAAIVFDGNSLWKVMPVVEGMVMVVSILFLLQPKNKK